LELINWRCTGNQQDRYVWLIFEGGRERESERERGGEGGVTGGGLDTSYCVYQEFIMEKNRVYPLPKSAKSHITKICTRACYLLANTHHMSTSKLNHTSAHIFAIE
jgi:hypothetical protein